MENIKRIVLVSFATLAFSGCVTQNYENDNSTPVVQNESSNNEIAMTRISLGLGYLKMGNTTQAKLNLEKAKRFAPKLVQVHTAFAHYYDSVGEPELAINSYEKALSLNATDADTLNNYGVFLCKQGNYQKAEQQILKAIAVPSYILVAQSYENLALCQLKSLNFSKAEKYLNKAILHSPSNASSLLQMTRLQYAKKDYVLAQAYLKRFEKATRRFSPDALALAYKIYQHQRNTKIAKNYATMLVKMFPNSFEAKQYLLNDLEQIEADTLAEQYQTFNQSSAKSKKRIVKLSPKNPVKPAAHKEEKFSVKKMSEHDTTKVNVANSETADIKKSQSKAPKQSNQESVTLPIHVVKKGDSLFSISKKYNIQMKAIERWNDITRGKPIKINDIIYLANPQKLTSSE